MELLDVVGRDNVPDEDEGEKDPGALPTPTGELVHYPPLQENWRTTRVSFETGFVSI
jgi:hypothetical protein